jgi:hypothetical protein
MNNKIFTDLVYESGIRFDMYNCPVVDNVHVLKKFAERIVKECIDQSYPESVQTIETHFGIGE